ncbi:MAG: hypothetical protein ABR543_15860 [Gemmatimonadaceae bacterium]
MVASRNSRVVRVAIMSALAVISGCDAPTVDLENPAYDPSVQLDDGSRGTYHWPLGSTISVYADNSNAPAGVDLQSTVNQAIALWEETIYYREFDARVVNDPAAADVVVQLSTAPALVIIPTGCNRGAAPGVTTICTTGRTVVALPFASVDPPPSKVKMAVSVRRDAVGSEAAFLSLVAHELGHVFGIGGHSNNAYDLMHAAPTAPRPSEGDARTLRFVLRRPSALLL